MANCSILNSTPAIGRTSTPLSRRSRKQNNAYAYLSPAGTLAHATGTWSSGFFNTQRPIQTIGRSMLGVERRAFSFWRVKGAWWSSRSSKPLSVPHTRDRGRFDSYPLRLNLSRHPERSRRIPWQYLKASQRDSSTSLGMTKIQRR